MKQRITIARGDGIGPEIMEATLFILKEAKAALEIEEIEIGEKVYLAGHKSGITEEAFASLRRTKVFLKAPISTPQGGGFRSLNVTIRNAFGLYANIRPCIAYSPFVATKHPQMNLVIIRENEEDLYAGIEYRQTPEVCHALKVISEPGCKRIIRYAFAYARRYGRKKVSCFTKDNILKISDGLFHKIFDEIGAEYPDIEKEHWIVDIGAAKIADSPELFDVVVLPNLYGDIISDITAQISGSIGLVGTANVGEGGAMFEAIHGTAPRVAGKNLANPSALILASVLMLVHIHQPQVASAIHNAWLKTIEEGIHTYDLGHNSLGTKEFAKEVVARLGKRPQHLTPVDYQRREKEEDEHPRLELSRVKRELMGVDVTFYYHGALLDLVKRLQNLSLPLRFIANRGMKIWPELYPETFCVDQYRARFESAKPIEPKEVLRLLEHLREEDIIRTENLYTFNGQPGYM